MEQNVHIIEGRLQEIRSTNAVGDRIKQIREAAEFKQSSLAPSILGSKVLSKIELGKRPARFLEVVAMSIIFGVPIEEFIPESLGVLLPKSKRV
jgi:transcriptional regulator with XRE-family HTH domain